jgi:V/A-type H+-transporting ATPase subunit D
MIYGVTANRMTLMKLRKRLNMASRGHTLLKHKLDELMKIFQDEIANLLDARSRLDVILNETYSSFAFAKSLMLDEAYQSVSLLPVVKMQLEISRENVLNIKTPVIKPGVHIESLPYELYSTNADLDDCIIRIKEVISAMLNMAEIQKRVELLIHEIEITRRRVNALEHVLIPQISAQVRFIKIKLDELERADITRLMRIKSIIRKAE